MNEIEIKRHSFDLAKNRLKEFSEKDEDKLKIDEVETDSWILFDHKVTGDEFNKRIKAIQDNFITINTTNNKVMKEFREVYNALDVLDKDYITSIVANVKAIEKTSNDVRVQQRTLKQHNERLANQQSNLDAHQAEIEKNVDNIFKIITVLKAFKEKFETYKHLTDIDKIWADWNTIQNAIRVVSNSITMLSKKTTEDVTAANKKHKALSAQVNRDIITLRNEAKSFKDFIDDLSEKTEKTANLLNNQISIIQETSTFVEQLKNVTHINDIDNIWDDLDVDKTNIKKINENIQMHQNKLNTLTTTSTEHKESINDLFKKLTATEKYIAKSRNLITELESFRTKVFTLNAAVESLNKRIKYAYWIAGGAAGFAIIELILLLIKVI